MVLKEQQDVAAGYFVGVCYHEEVIVAEVLEDALALKPYGPAKVVFRRPWVTVTVVVHANGEKDDLVGAFAEEARAQFRPQVKWFCSSEESVVGLAHDVVINGVAQLVDADFKEVQFMVEYKTIDYGTRSRAPCNKPTGIPDLELPRGPHGVGNGALITVPTLATHAFCGR